MYLIIQIGSRPIKSKLLELYYCIIVLQYTILYIYSTIFLRWNFYTRVLILLHEKHLQHALEK